MLPRDTPKDEHKIIAFETLVITHMQYTQIHYIHIYHKFTEFEELIVKHRNKG